ncbi:MAG: hypothetical protein A3C47_03895 [Omnitrophica bacterium RIFCSPHIGHO2_02_FULL_51_18]|nr:MAG: hypothetical protein A3C47_03895 [Omnitrophica bacterium RIFCSPHIGHO2_02_FULL_51_18]
MSRLIISLICLFFAAPCDALEYTGRQFRDPFQKPASAAPSDAENRQTAPIQMEQPLLKGIVWNSEKPQAVIGEAVVGVGGRVGNAQVTAIEKNAVTLTENGKIILLRMKKEEDL